MRPLRAAARVLRTPSASGSRPPLPGPLIETSVPALQIRGQDYLRDKKKIPAQPCAFQLVEVCGYNTAKGQDQRFSTERDDSYYARARSMGRKKFVFVSAALDLAKQQDVHALYACCRG